MLKNFYVPLTWRMMISLKVWLILSYFLFSLILLVKRNFAFNKINIYFQLNVEKTFIFELNMI